MNQAKELELITTEQPEAANQPDMAGLLQTGMKRRVQFAKRLFDRSRLARTVFVIAAWPPTYIADRMRGAVEGWRASDPPSWRRGMEWARDGEVVHPPTIPTSDKPAVVRRRSQP